MQKGWLSMNLNKKERLIIKVLLYISVIAIIILIIVGLSNIVSGVQELFTKQSGVLGW